MFIWFIQFSLEDARSKDAKKSEDVVNDIETPTVTVQIRKKATDDKKGEWIAFIDQLFKILKYFSRITDEFNKLSRIIHYTHIKEEF